MTKAKLHILLATGVLIIVVGCDGSAGAKLRGYTSEALLRVAMTPDRVLDGPATVDEAEYKAYRGTQQELARSRLVLMAALRGEKVVALRLRDTTDDPVDWLGSRLRVEFIGDSELMRVSVTCDKPEEACILAQAIVDAYLEEIVNVDHRLRRDRLNDVDRIYSDKDSELRQVLINIKALTEQLGDGAGDSVDIRIMKAQAQQLEESLREVARARNRLRLELRAAPRVMLLVPAEMPTKKT